MQSETGQWMTLAYHCTLNFWILFYPRSLLTISVPIGLQFGANPGGIGVLGDGQGLRTTSTPIDTTAGLHVLSNQTLAMVGGDVALTGGTLKTAGGRIELGSVAGPSLVSLTPIDKGWALGYEGVQNFGEIKLSQQAAVDASGNGGGDIQVQGSQVTLTGGSQIEASTLGSKAGGTLSVNAKDTVNLSGTSANGYSSGLAAEVYSGATGAGGNLTVKTGQLNVRDGAKIATDTAGAGAGGDLTIATGKLIVSDGAQVSARTFDQGKGGNLSVNASDLVELSGTASNGGFNSVLGTQAEQGSTGAGGNLTITTGKLIVQDGAQVSAGTFGQGQGGNLFVNASDLVELSGTALNGAFVSALSTTAEQGSTRAGGNLTITTGKLIVQDGAQVSAGTSGQGQGGNLSVNASDSVELMGTRKNADGSLSSSGLFTQAAPGSTGAAGNLTINTGNLTVRDGARVSASTLGTGAAGNLTIKTSKLIVSDGAEVQAITSGQGNGGNLYVSASDSVELMGTGKLADGRLFTSGLSTVTTGAGTAGDLTIATRQLTVKGGAQVFAGTTGQGQGGNLFVNASDSVELSGRAPDGASASALSTQTQGAGTAKDLTIATVKLIVSDGAQVSASTTGQGQGGNLFVNASDSVELMGTGKSADGSLVASGLFTQANRGATGAGGNSTITTGKLIVQDGAQVSAGTSGLGNGGNIQVNASNGSVDLSGDSPDHLFASGLFTSTSGVGQAGNITVNSNTFRLADGAVVNASTTGKGDITTNSNAFRGGTININANTFDVANGGRLVTTTSGTGLAGDINLKVLNNISLEGQRSGLFANTTVGSTGGGGTITIDPSRLTLTNGAGVAVNSQGTGIGGNLNVQAGSLTLDNRSFLSATTNSSTGGNIKLTVPSLMLMRRNSQISASAGIAGGSGNGGNIAIDTPFIFAYPSEDSDIRANAATGNGGKVQIIGSGNGSGIFGIQYQKVNTPESDITANSTAGGINGTVNINTSGIDPSRGLVALPTVVADNSRLIAQGCAAGDGTTGSKFIVTGRGGLPPSPGEPLSSDAVWSDARLPTVTTKKHRAQITAPKSSSPAVVPIVPATGWVFNGKGEVTLTASAPTEPLQIPWITPTSCHAQ